MPANRGARKLTGINAKLHSTVHQITSANTPLGLEPSSLQHLVYFVAVLPYIHTRTWNPPPPPFTAAAAPRYFFSLSICSVCAGELALSTSPCTI